MSRIEIISSKNPEQVTLLNRELHDHHARHYPEMFKPWDFDALLPAFTELLQRKDVACFVLQVDGVDAGYMLGWPQIREENGFQYESRSWYIDHLLVFAPFRGRGLSKVLLEKAQEIAREEGCTFLEIHHWSGNTFAKRSFEAFGFKEFNRKLALPIT